MKRNIYKTVVLSFVFTLFSCGNKNSNTAEAETEGKDMMDGLIQVTQAQFEQSKMSLGRLEEKPFPTVVTVNGMIDVPPENRAVVNATMGGYIKTTPLLVGDKVLKGQALVTIENPEFVTIQQEYMEVNGQLTYLKAEYIADSPTPNNKKVKDNDNNIYRLDDGSHGTFNADYPDLIKAKNGSSRSFTYDGVNETDGIAGVSYQSANGGVEYLGFSIELIYDQEERKILLDNILNKYNNLLSNTNNFISQNIILYPNPTSGLVKISNSKLIQIETVQIFNVYGQKLKVNRNNNILNIKSLAIGLYFVLIEDANGSQGTFKIIKR